MRLFLQLEISDWRDSSYEKPLLHYASSLASDIIGAELDSQSEGGIADIVIRLCNEAESIFVFIQAKEEPPGACQKVFDHLAKSGERIHTVILKGSNSRIEETLVPLGSRFLKEEDIEEIKSAIRLFARPS